MNEIALSNDLNVITAEINSYKQVAGQAIFEIGKRLKHVKENDLVHGEWMNWCKNNIGFSSDQANKYIKVHDEFGNSDSNQNLSVNALYLISSFSEKDRAESHETSPSKAFSLCSSSIEATSYILFKTKLKLRFSSSHLARTRFI